MNTLIVPLVGLAVVFVGLVVLIAIVKLMGVICGFVIGRRAETSGSVSSSRIEAEKSCSRRQCTEAYRRIAPRTYRSYLRSNC